MHAKSFAKTKKYIYIYISHTFAAWAVPRNQRWKGFDPGRSAAAVALAVRVPACATTVAKMSQERKRCGERGTSTNKKKTKRRTQKRAETEKNDGKEKGRVNSTDCDVKRGELAKEKKERREKKEKK